MSGDQLERPVPAGAVREAPSGDWSDAEIDAAVAAADPIVLRGLLYYLTGDEAVAATTAGKTGSGEALSGFVVQDPAEVSLLRERAAQFLRRCRERGGSAIAPGADERVLRSMKLTAGEEIPPEEVELWTEELALDPWSFAFDWPKLPDADRLEGFSVIVIGAGMGGLNAAVNLQKAGIPYTLIERNSGVGGTWWENRYPGARVDTPSRSYTHAFGLDFDWPGPFSPQRENLRYFDWIADTFGLRRNTLFDTTVTSVIWDEAAAMWEVTTCGETGTRVLRANAVISSIGLFRVLNLPEFEGADCFKGQSCHSARWPRDLVLEGKRVAVIGTGATGYQMIPEIAREAAHVTVFQRTPQWILPIPGYLGSFPPGISWLDRNCPSHKNFARFRSSWLQGPRERARIMDIDPEWKDPFTLSATNQLLRNLSIAYMDQKFAARPDIRAKMLPDHPIMSARPILVDREANIYDALVRDNVALCSEGVERITEDAVVTRDGEVHPVDVIVYATGFKANDFLLPMEVRGREGRRVEDLWAKDGPRAYLGAMLPGFPNFFMLYGPNTNPIAGLGVVNREAIATRYSISCIGQLIAEGKRAIEPTQEAYERFGKELDTWETRKIYTDKRAHNYYQTGTGRSAVNCPIPALRIWTLLRRPNPDDLAVR
jgi:4-hydroxyacetophenone monooxygenase